MKIGVISDTHLKKSNPLLENIVERYFKDVDLILHAGDITSMEVLNVFKEKEITAVFGNNDPSEVRKMLPQKEVITVDNFKIGLIHGWGFPMGLKKRVRDSFQGVHCIVYGHSHWAVNIRQNGILYFNPGAFSGGIFSFWPRSIGILTIEKDIRAEIIRI